MKTSESEKLIRRLYAITTDLGKGFESQVTQLLELGCERFNLDIGILSNISGEKYKVIHRVCPPEVGLEEGAEFELGSTYCARTMIADGPVGFDHVKESDMNTHPAYQAFGLEAYIGIPVKVNGNTYGTLNFSSPLPHKRKFNDIDIDALKLMASWLGIEIQRHESEALLKAANAKLLSYSENLTKQTEELERARILSDEAAQEKSKFLATMSHEIRTPLNGVLGMAELLTKTKMSVVQNDYVQTILSSGNLLLSIINDILDYSKLDAGKVELEKISFNLEWLVFDILEMMARTSKSDVQLILDYQSDAPRYFLGDPERLRQMLFNLLGNAIKFTSQGHIRLVVEYNNDSGVEHNVTILVEDTGIGMSVEQREQLFEPFNQGDLTTTRKYGGTGLGLAICKQLVGLMHGEVSLETALNKGSTFKINLPLSVAEAFQASDDGALQAAKVLLVNNDPVSRKVLLQLLLESGTKLTIVSKLALALTTLQKASNDGDAFQIVIVDNMPEIDEVSFGRSVSANKSLQQPELLVMTPLEDPEKEKVYQSAGYSAYLKKPVRSDIFLSVLKRLLAANKPAGELITKHSVIEPEQPALADRKLAGHVLLVEDNPVNQMVAMVMLQELGLTVDLAEDGLQAIQCWKDKQYDLILMDCRMPNLDGYEATRQIRQQESNGVRTPIIALTANAMEQDTILCRESGMDEVITKPYIESDLITVLEPILNHKN